MNVRSAGPTRAGRAEGPARLAVVQFSLTHDESDGYPQERVEVEVLPGDPVVVQVAGRLFYDTLSPLSEVLSRLVPATCSRLVLDLSRVPLCDSSALNLLVQTRSGLASAGGWLRLAGTQPMVDSVLEITNLGSILPRYATVDDASR
jgi:anti-anti-sigma factor